MKAGQRNCYEAIRQHVERYSLDDALFAVREVIRDQRDASAESKGFFEDALHHIEWARNAVQRAAENQPPL